ncbi:hypothetical protein LguiA_018537 [Lonicera macranthoides]
MVELKKAYAEIILNTAKEAAARVMESEQKSLRIQRDLCSTKESALLMLLNLKQKIDAKACEANNTSLSKQKRIEELEAQLNETEGTIIDLRAELEQARAQLDKAKSKNYVHFNEPIREEGGVSFENAAHFPAQLGKCCNPTTSDSRLDNFCSGNPNLASVIIKRKEPDSYRNRCTQRIHAIEMNLVDENLLSEDVSNEQSLKNGESIIKGDVLQVNEHTNVKKNSLKAEEQPVKVCKKLRRKKRYGKAKASSCRFRHNQQMKPRKPSLAFSNSKNISNTTNLAENSSRLEEKLPNKNDQAVCNLRRSIRKRKVTNRGDDFTTLCGSIRKSGEDRLRTRSEADIKGEIDSRLVTSSTELIDVPILEKPDYNTAESTCFSNLDSNLEVDNETLTGFAAKTSELTNEVHCGAGNKRLMNVKYTFSRKRKKESFSNPDESSSLGEGAVKNSSFVNESSRDSRRLVQVARQLISLSGKRWL